MCCSPRPAPRSPACAPLPRRSCPPSIRSRWRSPKFRGSACPLASFKAGGDAADQILAIEQPDIEPITVRRRLERCDKLREFALGLPTHLFGCFELDRNEPQWITRPASAEGCQIGRDHGGDLRVSAGRLVVGEKHDRLPRAG